MNFVECLEKKDDTWRFGYWTLAIFRSIYSEFHKEQLHIKSYVVGYDITANF